MKIKIDKKTEKQVDKIARENKIDRNVLITICQERIQEEEGEEEEEDDEEEGSEKEDNNEGGKTLIKEENEEEEEEEEDDEEGEEEEDEKESKNEENKSSSNKSSENIIILKDDNKDRGVNLLNNNYLPIFEAIYKNRNIESYSLNMNLGLPFKGILNFFLKNPQVKEISIMETEN